MSHIHVCLVSDQTVPNILSIHHFKPDKLLFITTSEMEVKNKTQHILLALEHVGLDYKNKYHLVKVQEDSILDCKKKIDEWISGREDATFTVNLTCGTKIMSIAVYECFKDYGSKMIYIPVGRNDFIMTFPKKLSHEVIPLSLRLSVTDYLAAYGLRVTNTKKLPENHADASQRKELSEWIIKNYSNIKGLLERMSEKLRKYRNEKNGHEWSTTYAPQHDRESDFFVKAGFQKQGDKHSKKLSQSEIIYFTGGWLEEFCYNELLKFKGQGIDDIALGIIPEKGKAKNEFDIMFTKDNSFYTVECKSLDQNDDLKADALYKIAALQKEFGLRVGSFFVSTSPHILKEDGTLRFAIQARSEQFNTTVIPPHEVIHFSQKVAEKLKIKEQIKQWLNK